MALPQSVIDATRHEIVAEDAVLDILHRRLSDLHTTSWVNQEDPPPYVLIRQATFVSSWTADDRFMEDFYVTAESFTEGPDADVEGPRLLAAIGDALKRAGLAKDVVLDGLGWVQEGRLIEPPRRRADFANSEGPVQYADLPQNYARFISTYRVKIKRANIGPNIYDY